MHTRRLKNESSEMSISEVRNEAEYLAKNGFNIFPLAPGGNWPAMPGGLSAATSDQQQIEMWWRRNPDFNIGISTDGLVVVESDGKHDWLDGFGQSNSLCECPAVFSPLSDSLFHIYRQPGGRSYSCSIDKLGMGITVHSRGGFVCLPPSEVECPFSRDYYRWLTGCDQVEKIGPPPRWLINKLDLIESGHEKDTSVSFVSSTPCHIQKKLRRERGGK